MYNFLDKRRSQYICALWTVLLIFSLVLPASALDLGIGKSYALDPKPNYESTKDEFDGKQLTDGSYTSGHFWTSKTTVGWQEASKIQIEIDLEKKASIGKICINTAQGIQAEVSFPQRIEMFIGPSRNSFVYIGNLMQGQEYDDGAYEVRTFCSKDLSAYGRYVWLFIHPKGPYTFIDEIKVLGGGSATRQTVQRQLGRDDVLDFEKRLAEVELVANNLRFSASRMLATVEKDVRSDIARSTVGNIRSLVTDLEQGSFADEQEIRTLEKLVQSAHVGSLKGRFKEPIVIWRDNPWAPFTKLDTPTAQQAQVEMLTVDLLMNGTHSEAINVTNASTSPQTIQITAQVASTARSAPTINLFEAYPISTAKAKIRADPLIPLVSSRLKLDPGESKQLWLSILAGDSAVDTYPGQIVFDAQSDTNWAKTVQFNIQVWPIEMPAVQHLMVNNWAYLNWRLIIDKVEKAIKDLVVHHTNLFTIHPAQLPWPRVSDGRMSVDYTGFDKVMARFRKTDRFLFFLYFNDKQLRSLRGVAPFMSQEWETLFSQWITDWSKHLVDMGIGYDRFAFYPVDEPKKGEETGVLYDTARLIKRVNPNLRTYTTHTGATSTDFDKLVSVIDTFQVIASRLTSPLAASVKSSNRELWSYSAGGGGKDGDPLSFYRNQAWKAFRAGATGIGFWAYADIGSQGSAWNDLDGNRPDYAVIYDYDKGSDIVSSKRWEAWREGVEDYELLLQTKKKVEGTPQAHIFWQLVDDVVASPFDLKKLLAVRRAMLEIASR